ncbi:MAG: hypothetical protein EBV06_09105 [Planctomycetia bacterium]|nr:hypothetical protein [Planctomycetia bacterium]
MEALAGAGDRSDSDRHGSIDHLVFLGINRNGREQPNQNGTNGNGRSIVVNSVGFFWASNNVVIQDGPTPPTLSSHVSKQQAEGK